MRHLIKRPILTQLTEPGARTVNRSATRPPWAVDLTPDLTVGDGT